MITQGNPNALILLQVTVPQLDFITKRLTAGKMTYEEAKASGMLIDILVAQANNKELQALANPPAPPTPETPAGSAETLPVVPKE